jgi:dipeptidyl aminopeptidase/acylaminoacyl peptidase
MLVKRRWSIFLVALYAATSVSAQTAGKEALTHESMWMMKRVSSPALSPDGKWVVFSVTDPSYDSKEQSSDLWIAGSNGKTKPRRLTATKDGESDVTWSPDGRMIAFSAKREGDEANQIYLQDAAGGEARRITTLSTGARSPRFSPDGKALLYTSMVYPGAMDDEANKKAAQEEKERKEKVRVYDVFPIRLWDRWLDDKQVHLILQNLDPAGPAKDLLAGTQLARQPGFGVPTAEGSRQDIDAEWAPDGKSIVFAVTTARNTSAYAEVPVNLYRVAVTGGEPERISSANGEYSSPSFSPDGKTLFAKFSPNNRKVYNLTRLVAFDWPSMKNERVVAQTDRSVDDFVVTPDGRTIYFTAEDSGLEKIFTVPVQGGQARVFIDPKRGVYSALRMAEKSPVMIALWASSIDPAEVVRIDINGKTHSNLTEFAVADARKIDWQPPQHFWFTSKRGRKIHNMIVLPPNFDPKKKYPLFVLIHGGAHNMWRDQISLRWNYHLLAKPGYVMLMTNYTGSTGFGEQFAQNIQGDPLRGPAEELMEGADEAIRRFPFIDATRQVAGGASYGGHLANALEAWSGTRFKALISHAGLVNLESQWATSDVIYHREIQSLGPVWEQNEVWRTHSPARFAAQFRTPMLLSVGEKDYRVPLNNTLEMWSLLQRRQIPSRLLVWPEENHWILNGYNSRLFYKEVADWLGRWVNGTAKATTN